MIASVQYNDLRVTAAADIADGLYEFTSEISHGHIRKV